MKRRMIMAMAAMYTVSCMAGCQSAVNADAEQPQGTSGVEEGAQAGASADPIQVVTTIFPEYDWVKTILGDQAANAEITMLLDNGVDLHSFEPTAEDIMKISDCDMFVYVGGESDEWVADVLRTADNKDMVVINLLDVLGERVKEEEIVEGMEHDHEHEHEEDEHEEHDHEEHEEGEHEHEEEMDEHVWLSLKNTQLLCDAIADGLGQIDAENAEEYKANAAAYKAQLSELDAAYAAAVNEAGVKTLLFGDRFPFRYMVDDYGLSYYAAFAGCSAEAEASFETIMFLAEKTDELGLSAIMTIEGPEHKIAEAIRDNTEEKDQQILTLDSMQGTTSSDVANGVTYLSVMTKNLEVIKEALQ